MEETIYRPITINVSMLEAANYFGVNVREVEDCKPFWLKAIQEIADRDNVPIVLDHSFPMAESMTIDGEWAWSQEFHESPEYLWYEKASDEALAIACRSSERPVTAICITVAGGNIMSVHANTEDVAILIRDMDNIERGGCDPLIGFALQAKDPADVYGLAGYPAEVY